MTPPPPGSTPGKPNNQPHHNMNNIKTTSYNISICVDGIFACNGAYDLRETENRIWGVIRDCPGVLGKNQDDSQTVYEAIEDAILEMDEPDDGQIEVAGVKYSWTLSKEQP